MKNNNTHTNSYNLFIRIFILQVHCLKKGSSYMKISDSRKKRTAVESKYNQRMMMMKTKRNVTRTSCIQLEEQNLKILKKEKKQSVKQRSKKDCWLS